MASLEPLLASLDPDPELAAEEYLRLYRTLRMLFERRGLRNPEEATDVTLDKVAEKIILGEPIKDIFKYSHGVAKYVYLERSKPGRDEPIDDLINEIVGDREDTRLKELMHSCLYQCVDQLPEAESVLLRRYYGLDETWLEHLNPGKRETMSSPQKRAELAGLMGLTRERLRVLISRLRLVLDPCVKECVRKSENKFRL